MKAPARFHTTLQVERARPDKDEWRLTSLLAFYSAKLDGMIIVPRGFVTDFASVPRLPLAYLLFGGVAQEAAVVHDFLYSGGVCPRKLADEIFAEASKACGVSAWRRGPMWLGIRLFGGSRYATSQPGLQQDPARELERQPELE